MKTNCECAEPTCAHHLGRACPDLGLIILFNVDVPDHTGTLMCATCRDQALDSGRYDAGRLGARSTR